ncbi:MAG: tetratricopeptide repeat protein [Pseudomonadota bacterium]|nr:tetratricopeptide repeat protein [Pseudomonadota bacterium]
MAAATRDQINNQPQTAAAPETAVEYGSFTKAQLYQAIISELGAQRGVLEDASDSYFKLALETKDLGIIRRAVQFASANNDLNALLQLGLLWSEIDPSDPQPELMLSFQFLETGNYEQALSHMVRVIELGGEIDFSALSARTSQLNASARASLIASLRQLAREFSDQQSIQLTLVQLLAQNGDYLEALTEFDQLLKLIDLNPRLVLLQAQVLQSAGETDDALETLAEGVRKFDDNRNLRLTYARLLIQNERYEMAQAQFATMMTQDPQDWETLFSMALLDVELEQFDQASDKFTQLAEVDDRADEANYYLGYVNEQRNNLPLAIAAYREVRIGTQNFLAAQQRAVSLAIQLGELDSTRAYLSQLSRGQPRLEILFHTIESGALIQAGHADRARDLLDRALNKYPNEADLLFARVLLFDSLGNKEGSEQDLKQIIRIRPEDSRALNHLGYMLADQTERYQEALELIERAIAISPDDPAIIDSLGWAQFKLGRYEEALTNLRRAYAVFPDAEVASHVGEVLWMMGREQEAVEIWRGALQNQPDSDLIKEVVHRLQADL